MSVFRKFPNCRKFCKKFLDFRKFYPVNKKGKYARYTFSGNLKGKFLRLFSVNDYILLETGSLCQQ